MKLLSSHSCWNESVDCLSNVADHLSAWGGLVGGYVVRTAVVELGGHRRRTGKMDQLNSASNMWSYSQAYRCGLRAPAGWIPSPSAPVQLKRSQKAGAPSVPAGV